MPRYLALAVPPMAMTVVLAAIVCMEMIGAHPLTRGEPKSPAEAIAMDDPATAARLIEDGAPAGDIELVRAGILGDRPVLATPAEAAVIRDQPATVAYLASRGAATTDRLACLAMDVSARKVQGRFGTAQSCPRGEALQAVLQRP
jgi:hypothetical protein